MPWKFGHDSDSPGHARFFYAFVMRLPEAETPPNALEALKRFTTVVADTGSFESMRAYQPQDATTNPTLIMRALEQPQYASIVEQVKAQTKSTKVADRSREVLVAFGCEILKIVPGRVSTEVDARLSFDTAAMVAEAKKLLPPMQRAALIGHAF